MVLFCERNLILECVLLPSEVDSSHPKEFFIVRSEEFLQSAQRCRVHAGMTPSFRLSQTAHDSYRRPRVTHKARESRFDRTGPEISFRYRRAKTEKSLNVGHGGSRVGDQSFAADEMDPVSIEVLHPAAQVHVVKANLKCPPGGVHLAVGTVGAREAGNAVVVVAVVGAGTAEGETFKWRQTGSLGARLGVVGESARHWVAKNYDQPHVGRHLADAFGSAARHKIARRLLDGQLMFAGQWHHSSKKDTGRTCAMNHTFCSV